MVTLICPGCKQGWETPQGADWLEERQRLDAAGWKYGGTAWRCQPCHITWVSKPKGKKKVKA